MNNILIKIIIGLAIFSGVVSCEIDEDKAMMKENVASNEMAAMPSETYVLLFDQGSSNFDQFNWTSVDYGFPASVDYTLQIDVAGDNFANAIDLATTNNNLSTTLTNSAINKALLNLDLEPEQPASVQFRVVANVDDDVEPVYSSVLDLTITPYAVTFPPIYIVGDAQAWDLGKAMKLESTGPGTYEGVGSFVMDGKFRLFDTPAWDAEQWGYSYFSGGTIDSELADGADGDSNFLFTAEDGIYKVTVSLTDKTITVEPSAQPTLFIIGDAQGWDLNAALELKSLGNGEFEGIGNFQMDGKFRFFASPDWGATQYGYSYFDGGTIAADLADGADGDSNFLFTSATGIYKVTVSLSDKSIAVESAEEPTLYIIGDDQSWNLANAFKLTWKGGGKYEGTTDFTNGSIFRFFVTPDWGAKQYNYNNFVDGTIDEDNLSGTTEGDANFTVEGVTGTYTISVDLYNSNIEMNQ